MVELSDCQRDHPPRLPVQSRPLGAPAVLYRLTRSRNGGTALMEVRHSVVVELGSFRVSCVQCQ